MGNVTQQQAQPDEKPEEIERDPPSPQPQAPVAPVLESDKYEGDTLDGRVPHGRGIIRYKTRDEGERLQYEGEWENGRRHGYGVLIWRNGSRYEGFWAQDKLSGNGILLWNTALEYRGEWKDNKFHGRGIMMWPNQKRYEGEWNHGLRQGFGKFFWPPDDDRHRASYEGNWEQDKRQGEGIMRWTDGSEYVGFWKNGKRHGQGTQRFPNGDVYVGEWKEGRRCGHGLRKYPDGTVWEGEWLNDLKHGKGVLHEPWGRSTNELYDRNVRLPVSLPQAVPSLDVLCIEKVARDFHYKEKVAFLPEEVRTRIIAYWGKRGQPVDYASSSIGYLASWLRPPP